MIMSSLLSPEISVELIQGLERVGVTPTLLKGIHAAATLYMVGLIWLIQLVHYPLFALVGESAHLSYHRAHVARTAWAVGPAMIIELVTTILITLLYSEQCHGAWWGAGLLFTIWISTASLQVPCHQRLSEEFSVVVHRRLVNTNWIRTVGWSARGWIAISWLT